MRRRNCREKYRSEREGKSYKKTDGLTCYGWIGRNVSKKGGALWGRGGERKDRRVWSSCCFLFDNFLFYSNFFVVDEHCHQIFLLQNTEIFFFLWQNFLKNEPRLRQMEAKGQKVSSLYHIKGVGTEKGSFYQWYSFLEKHFRKSACSSKLVTSDMSYFETQLFELLQAIQKGGIMKCIWKLFIEQKYYGKPQGWAGIRMRPRDER